MDRELIASLAIIITGVLIAGYVTATSLNQYSTQSKGKGLLVVVTFPSLASDIKQLLCPQDRVISIVPPGVDPHTYTLSLGDIEKAKRADLVISTGHAPFEIRLRDYINSKKLIEIPRIPGIRIENIIGTSSPNLHMPVYDPHNYIVFVNYVAKRLAELRPACSSHYLAMARKVSDKIAKITESSPRLNVQGVGSSPLVQYAVSWLGIRLEALMVTSPEAGITSQQFEKVKEFLASHRAEIAVIVSSSPGKCTPMSKADEKTLALAEQYKVLVLCVPSPLVQEPIPDKLETIIAQAKALYPAISMRWDTLEKALHFLDYIRLAHSLLLCHPG